MRKHRHLILVLVLGFVVLLVLLFVLAPTPPANLAVSFVGVTNDAAGAPMSIFSITNRGAATVVIWGYYKIDAKQQFAVRHPTIFGGGYTFLAPRESQTAAIYVPETKGSWKVSIGYGCYDLQCRLTFLESHLPQRVFEAIPERFRDVPKELVASDWIELR